MSNPLLDVKHLLTNEQMAQFLTQGFLRLNTDFTEKFHETIQQKIKSVYAEEGNPGNNILPRIPEIQQCFDHPVVRGALSSILGPEYVMDAHRHGHHNVPHSNGMEWHKDDYWGNRKMLSHRPWYAMIFYYTQDVTEDMGPSAIIPGSQNYYERLEDESEYQLSICGKAGTMALIDYDIWHTAMANRTDLDRFMLKFLFYRMEVPERPNWNVTNPEWETPQNPIYPILPSELLWKSAWNWLNGDPQRPLKDGKQSAGDSNETNELIKQLQDTDYKNRMKATDALGSQGEEALDAIPALVQALNDAKEPVSLNAAYALAAVGPESIPELAKALKSTSKQVVRHACYGLIASGSPAIPVLAAALDDEYPDSDALGYMALALGELGKESASVVPQMIQLLKHDSVYVRQHTVEALGMIKQPAADIVPALSDVMLNDSNGHTRFLAGLSLSRIGSDAGSAIPALAQSLYDPNRYVSAIATVALERIRSTEALDVLLPFYRSARWCPITTKDSRY